MNEAIGKIRAALKGHDLLGAEAIELKPGAVVLVVLRYAAKVSPDEVHSIRQNWATMAEALQAEGVRAVACCVPHGFGLDVIEVAEAPPDDRSVVGADGREIARLRPLPTAPTMADLMSAPHVAAGVEWRSAAPVPDEPFPWDAPAEGYGLDVSPLLKGSADAEPWDMSLAAHGRRVADALERDDLVITVGPDGIKVKL